MIYAERLSEHDIRLLTVLPSLDDSAPITCELHRYDVSAAPAYEGLSYAWGDPNVVATVACNGIEVKVTKSLRNALWRVRDTEEPKIIWADALCVNQSDIQEKNVHVPLMGRVFSQATNTVIYLGEASQVDAVEAEAGLNTVWGLVGDSSQRTSTSVDNPSAVHERILEMLSGEPLPSLSWGSIEKLYNAAWFLRTWCVQEIMLARESALESYVMYGHVQIPYRRVAVVALFLVTAEKCGFNFARKLPLSSSIAVLSLDLLSQEKPNLTVILALFLNHLASDPRDKVYGVLGILLHRFGYDLEGIVVDYTKSVIQVYTETAVEIIRTQQNLELLNYIAHPAGVDCDSGPTWVPRWNRPLGWRMIVDIDGTFRSNCSASELKEGKVPISWELQGDQLLVSGLQYELAAKILPLTSDANVETTFVAFWKQTQMTRESCFDRQEELFALARTFAIGRVATFVHFNKANDAQREAFMADFLAYVHLLVDRCCLQCPGRPEDDLYTVDANGTKCMGSANRYATRLKYGCQGRTFFETTNGDYGIGPGYMHAGDIIVGIIGGSSPFALRAKEKDYLALGPVYMDNLMDGNLFGGMLSKGMKKQFALI